MSKLLVSIGTLSSGGAERVLSVLSKSLADNFDEVIYLMWVKAPVFYEIDSRIRLVCLPDYCGKSNRQVEMIYFRRFVKGEKPDIILSFLQPFNMRVLLSTIGLGVRKVVAERNDPNIGIWPIQLFEKILYRVADGILVQTQTIARFYKGTLAKKVSIIYNPVNIAPELVGKALTCEKDKKIISVARLMPQKHHEVTIRAFVKFVETHPDYKLVIFGDGPERANLEKLVRELDLVGRVVLPGTSKQIHKELESATMFVQSSSHEGMSNSMIEAMCLGVPCICTKVSGAIDLIQSGVNGILFDIGDEEALLREMTKVADDDRYMRSLGVSASKIYSLLEAKVISNQWIGYLRREMK